MSGIKLSQHKFKKGKFISPLNDIGFDLTEMPWFQRRLPEYIWIGLIINKYGRNNGLNICGAIIQELKNLYVPKLGFSELLALDNSKQEKIWHCVSKFAGDDILTPLTLLITFSNYPIFAKHFCKLDVSIEDRIKDINDVMKKAANHQSDFATDIRFLIVFYEIILDRMKFSQLFMAQQITKYPTLSHDNDEMKLIRPTIRSIEIGLEPNNKEHMKFLENFWRDISMMTECDMVFLRYEKNADDASVYMKKLKSILTYYNDIYTSSHQLDNKMLVILGIATYSYKRILELVNCNLFNEISGRSIVRVLIENYIMIKYLLKHETDHVDIWGEYQYYGIGQYKLICKRAEDAKTNLENSHVEYKYLNILVNEFKGEDFIDMDTNYFNKHNIREKAIDVNEKELYGLYYDYDSAFEHGLWGAIRESSLIKCEAVGHQLHCIPDIDNQQHLKSVWNDAKLIMTKILLVLKDIYGLPEQYTISEE